jgi:hypothetical protein
MHLIAIEETKWKYSPSATPLQLGAASYHQGSDGWGPLDGTQLEFLSTWALNLQLLKRSKVIHTIW